MGSLKEIKSTIEKEIENLEHNQEYEGSEEFVNKQLQITQYIKDTFDYDFEDDDDALQYFDKASMVEIWKYYLDNILPRFE